MSRKRKSVITHEEQKKKKKVILRKKKNSNIIDGEEKHQKKETDDESPPNPHLPEELIVENILTKFSVGDLLSQNIYTVSKLWHSLIFRDKRFASSHYADQKNKTLHDLSLVFSLMNVYNAKQSELACHFFKLQKDGRRRRHCDTHNLKLLMGIVYPYRNELVGYCNGLACSKLVSEPGVPNGLIIVLNQATNEKLCLTYDNPRMGRGRGILAKHLCHGFGFDSSTQEYKVVVIYTIMTIADDQRFICMVVTLGTKSWRKIVTCTSEMSPPPGCGAFPRRMVTRPWKSFRTSGTLCRDLLLWKISNSTDGGDKNEMLLSFNIHDEKIHFIRLPTECTSLTPTTNEHQYLEIDHHLLEFKGYPCVARTEKIKITDHQHRSRPSCERLSGFCCFRFNVHLYLLKDKVKQIWIKEEGFDVRMKDEGIVRHPFCCYFDHVTTSTTPPTRILGFSGQVLLYWYNGQYLIFYNLQTKHLKVVKCSRSEQHRELFWDKMYGVNPHFVTGEDGNISCPYNDYQLHARVENILSLKNFIPVPEGEVVRFDHYHDMVQFIMEKNPAGWVSKGRTNVRYYGFL